MVDLNLSRIVDIPDRLRVARAKSFPNLGPRILFFSGGSALNDIARSLKHYTHNSMHLITPFDSGGSSQVLREAFDMPAVGDLRSRLMALADETVLGQPDIYRLFTYRFAVKAEPMALQEEFCSLLSGRHAMIRAVSQPMRGLILSQLKVFDQHRAPDFSFAGASVGNLILAGGYLANERALEPVLFLMSKMVAVKGTVRSIVDRNLDLGALLMDGSTVIGQRQISGKEVAPITAPIKELFLVENGAAIEAERVKLPERNRDAIADADLICYAPGSLYSSVIANLLPAETGRTIAGRAVPKVYLPSLGSDPECIGMTLVDQVAAILQALRQDVGDNCANSALMDVVLCDSKSFDPSQAELLQHRFGIACVAVPLAQQDRADRYDPDRVSEALISMT
ncbi:GAK system CofD-like protein [Epibacterium sp. SM1969]|uniref:GAK system CofD-like protein n=1 Tax=Tritonibacter aquimaris TaxID=2663379 RepID=A0A844B0M0_9RHOB|nr:GAK system CofD-like protein [Tritonibacter aquimaris]